MARVLAVAFLSFLLWGHAAGMNPLFMLSSLGPTTTTCPASTIANQYSLVRSAQSLCAGEASYYGQRTAQTAGVLRQWLLQFNRADQEDGNFTSVGPMPVLAMATSGGGIRSMLTGAGVVQAFDNRDTNTSVSGIYQALTYHAGHETGARLVGALAANNYPLISQVKALWNLGFRNDQNIPVNEPASAIYSRTVLGMTAKALAGFDVGLVDALGGILSYQMLYATDPDRHAGSAYSFTSSMSGIRSLSNFTSANAPYPIMTAFGIRPTDGLHQCYVADLQSHGYEFHPFEFGSWDYGVRSFIDTAFLGSQLNNGATMSQSVCITNFDNLGVIVGASSSVYNYWCSAVPNRYLTGGGGISSFNSEIAAMAQTLHPLTYMDEYAIVPNPWYNFSHAPQLATDQNLYLVGGEQGSRDLPLWPLIQPERNIDVIIATDNSSPTGGENLPNGTQIYATYQRALQFGLTRMPAIPSSETFAVNNLTQSPMTVFGCDDTNVITIIYLPNRPISFPSNQNQFRLTWEESDVNAMIENGKQIGQGVGASGPEWGSCIACVLMKKTSVTPSWCEECFDRWCWRGGESGAITSLPL